MKVIIDTRNEGVNFATVGIVRDARSKRVLHISDTIRPYGFYDAAMCDAESWAKEKGYEIVKETDGNQR